MQVVQIRGLVTSRNDYTLEHSVGVLLSEKIDLNDLKHIADDLELVSS